MGKQNVTLNTLLSSLSKGTIISNNNNNKMNNKTFNKISLQSKMVKLKRPCH